MKIKINMTKTDDFRKMQERGQKEIDNFLKEQRHKEKEIQEKGERALEKRLKIEDDKKESREIIRIQRIGDKPQLVYVLDMIIERCQISEDKETITMDAYSLGIEENHLTMCEKFRPFFIKLKDYGCFETVEFGNTYFSVTKPNIQKLIEYSRKIERDSEFPIAEVPLKKSHLKTKGKVLQEILKKFSNATRWEEIKIEFLSDGESVEIFIKDERIDQFHFDQLGFKKKTTNQSKSVKSWEMFQVMAMSRCVYPYKEEAHHSTKKDLQQKLKNLFPNCISDPIVCDKEKKEFSCRIKLVNKMDSRNTFLEKDFKETPNQYLKDYS